MQKELKILIVTGQRSKAIHYRNIFKEWKIKSSAVSNSFDAIKIFNQQFSENYPFDFVMTEYILSGQMTGLGLAKLFSDIYSDVRIMIFPTAELFEQDVMQEYNEIRENMIEPDLSNAGLRKIIDFLLDCKNRTVNKICLNRN